MARRPRRRDHARGARARLSRERPSLLDRVPTAAWIVAGVVGLLVVVGAVAESERKHRLRLEDERRITLTEHRRAREKADYGWRLRNEPGFHAREAARVGAMEDAEERRQEAEGRRPTNYWDRF